LARVRTWLDGLPPRRRERVTDGAVAAALAVVNAASVVPYRAQIHPFWLALFLVVAQCVPLAWRRSRPLLMSATLSVPRAVYDGLHLAFAPAPLAPAISLATIMDRSSTTARWATGIISLGVIAWAQAQPGHTQPYDAIVTLSLLTAASIIGIQNRARRAALAAQEHRADAAEAQSDERAALAAAAERMRIARELHDVVAHHVSLVAVQAEAAASLLPDRPAQAAGPVDLIGQTARQAMTELRRLLGVLRESNSNQDLSPERAGLAPAPSLSRVAEVIAQVRGAGLPVELTARGTALALSPSIDLTAYRIIQEALTNTMRHAPGAAAQVDIAYEGNYVTIQVTNTGPGPGGTGANGNRPNGAGIRGYGLAGIAERVASCGGTLALGPREAGGFAVTARLPLQ
jgi:signal transduction histidine kinase